MLKQKLESLQAKLDKAAFLLSEAEKDFSLGILAKNINTCRDT